MTPKTHILLKKDNQINCNSIVPQYYKIGKTWTTFLPKAHKISFEIKTLNPKTRINWKREKMEFLASSRIYNQEDLKKFQQHIAFPLEKTTLLNTLARGMEEEENAQGGLIKNLLDENALIHIAKSTWEKFQNKFITFGSVGSAIIIIFIIISLVKKIINIIVRGYTFHALFGCWINILGAIFASIAHLLIVLRNKQLQKRNKPETSEVREIIIDKPILKSPAITLPRPVQKQQETSFI